MALAGSLVTDPILTTALVLARTGTRWPCCELVARVVRDVYPVPQAAGSLWWRLMNVWDPRQPWSAPQTIADDLGDGYTDGAPLMPNRWYVCQGWRRLSGPGGTVGPGDTGHTWLWYATSPTEGVVLDSSTTRGVRLGGAAYTGQPMPAGRPWAERVAAYSAGIAVALLQEA